MDDAGGVGRRGGALSQPLVVEVRVQGNRGVSTSAILSHVKTRVGEPYDEVVVKADEQRLLETKQFSSILVTKTATNKGVIITFNVTERGRIECFPSSATRPSRPAS